MERAVLAEGVGFAVLNLMSDNPGMRWDIETTAPGHRLRAAGRLDRGARRRTSAAPRRWPRRSRALAADLEAQVMQSGW